MGGTASSSSRSSEVGRSESSNRMSIIGPRLPMPDNAELEQRFAAALVNLFFETIIENFKSRFHDIGQEIKRQFYVKFSL